MKKKLVSGEREEGPATASGMEVKQRDGSDAGKTDRDGKIAQRRPNVEGGENGGAISVTGGKEKKRKKICDAKPGRKRTKGPQSFFSFFFLPCLILGRRVERKRRRQTERQERLSSLKREKDRKRSRVC